LRCFLRTDLCEMSELWSERHDLAWWCHEHSSSAQQRLSRVRSPGM
jgi:hypothetical protein